MRFTNHYKSPEELAEQKAQRARHRAFENDVLKRTRPPEGDALAMAAWEGGGVLLRVRLSPLPTGLNGGCGAPTHVTGTNGGTMPCGSLLTQSGRTEPYFCAHCEPGATAEEGEDTGPSP